MSAMIGALRAELSASIAQFQADMNKAAGSVSSFAKRAKKVGQSMQSAGRTLSVAVTAPIGLFGAATLKAAGDFEMGMNRVAAVSGATAEQLAKMREQAKELGATTQFSASQAADAMGFLAQAGFKADQIMAAMPDTLKLAAAAQLDMGSAADIVSNILQGYGKKVGDLTHVNDVLVKAFTSSNTNLQQLGEAMKYAGPVASAAGVQFEATAAALGMMGNAGIQASMAGTSLRGAISHMLNPTGAAKKAMKALGLTFVDSKGKLLPLVDIVRELEKHADNAGLFMQLFGQRAGPAMAALVSQGADALQKFTGELENSGGVADRVSAVQMKGFNGAMRAFKSAVENLQITLADSGMIGWATDFVKSLAELVRNLAKTNPHMLKFVTVVAGVAAVIGPMLFVFGGMAKGFGLILPLLARLGVVIGPVVAAIGNFILALRAGYSVVQAMGIVMAANPIGVALLAIAAAAFAVYEAWKHWDAISAFLNDVGQALSVWFKDHFGPVLNAVKPLIDAVVANFRLAGTFISQLIRGDWSGALNTLKQMFMNVFGALSGIVGSAVTAIGHWLKDKLAAILDWVGEKVQGVTNFFKDMYDAVIGHSYVPDMVTGIKYFFGQLETVMVKPAEKAASGVTDVMSKMGDKVADTLTNMIMNMDFSMSSIRSAISSISKDLFLNPIGDFLKGAFKGGFSSATSGLSDFFGGFLAEGGPLQQGRWYIAGEHGPEPVWGGGGGAFATGYGDQAMAKPSITFNVQTPDAQSFMKSESQISAMLARAVSRGQRNS